MIKEFRDFLMRGNLVELAVAFVMGLAFAALVSSFVDNLVMPIVAMIIGKPDFSDLTFTINDAVFRYGAVHHRSAHVRRDRGGDLLLRRQADERPDGPAVEAGGGGALRRGAPPPGTARRAPHTLSRWLGAARLARPTGAARGRRSSRAAGRARRSIARRTPGDEYVARGRVVPDRERLAGAAEDDLLVGDEAGQANRVDRHLALHPRGSRLRRPGRGVELRVGVELHDLRAVQRSATPPPRSASSGRPRARSSGRRSTGRPPRAPGGRGPRCRSPSSRSRPARALRGTARRCPPRRPAG